ncbi:maleylpyruvate isomerase family mycothiol-dependent enzyme [Streptomyces sp. NPDC005279]|uniref:maleylpyruvate isomerase family mycothiol-dependent enzyme n=1 Tax=Streptomyces sp. NPDC005279 TaxID=3364712 RepID=UPI0036AF7209
MPAANQVTGPETSGEHGTMEIPDHSRWASTPAAHRNAVAAETARFVSVVKGAQPATPVPSCPGWTLVDLIRHTGSVQRWFSVLLRQLVQEPPRSRDVDLRLPADEDGYPDWLASSAAEAASAFAVTDPDAPMWVWGADRHARFWVRRMLFETLVHRADAELAVGLRPEIDRDLAADGVDEFLVNLPFASPFAPKVANLRGDGETIRFRCTDSDGDWLVRLRPDGFGIDHDAAATGTATPADATVQGAAADLLLLMYGRLDRGSEVFESSGNEDLLTLWFSNSEF